jgi:hypothetical protein
LTSKIAAACSLSMLVKLATGRAHARWWLVQRTPFRRRVMHWLFAPQKLFHGCDAHLYQKLRPLICCHPRFLRPVFATHYGVRHLEVGPLHAWWGENAWSGKVKGVAWR